MKPAIMCGSCCQKIKDIKEERGLLSNPRRNRGCTDIVIFLIFVIFLCGMIFIAAFSISKGDPFRLVYGTDSYGNTCDEDNSQRAVPGVRNSGKNLKGRQYLFFMNLNEIDTSMRICVNKCPENNLVTPRDLFDFSQQTGSLLCRYDIDLGEYDHTNRSSQGPCPVLPVYKSESLLNRCIPSDMIQIKDWLTANVANNVIAYINSSNIFNKALRDLYASWNIVIALCFLSVAFSIFLVLLIRFLASVAAWLIVAFVGLASLMGTAFLWWTFISNKNKLDLEEQLKIPLLEVDINSEFAFLTFSVTSTAFTIILLLVILALRQRIALVVYLLKEAGLCVSRMPMLLLQPVWTFFLLLMFFVYWVTVLAFLSTSETPSVTEQGLVTFKGHETVTYFWWYHLVGLMWVSEFIIACQSFIISGAVARWYFTKDKKQIGFPVLGTLGQLIMFHQGSVALGALVLTIVKAPRAVLIFISKRLKSSDKECARCCVRCCCCCVWCVDKCLRYLSASAYTVVAITGKNFCTSAKKGYHIVTGDVLRVSAVNGSVNFILFLGKVSVMAATTSIGVVWFKSQEELHFYAVPVLLVSILSYYIAHCFLSVYQMILEALMLCFCEDRDLNDGSPEHPYFGSSTFMVRVARCSSALSELSERKHEANTEQDFDPAQV